MKKFTLLILSLALVFLNAEQVRAATISMFSNKTEIESSDEYIVSLELSINVATSTAYFLRGVFYKPNTSHYCGLTWNGNNWFKGPYSSDEGWKSFFPISIDQEKWSGQIKVKIDPEDSGCSQTGTYNFKIERFTLSGGSSFDSQTPLVVEVSIPSPTLTQTPTQKPTKSPPSGSTNTSVAITDYQPTKALTDVTDDSPTDSVNLVQNDASISGAVLGISQNPTVTSSSAKTSKVIKKNYNKTEILGISALSAGGILLLLCGSIMIILRKKGKIEPNADI